MLACNIVYPHATPSALPFVKAAASKPSGALQQSPPFGTLRWTADRSRRLPVRRMHPPGSRQAPPHSPHLHRAKPLLLPIAFPSSLSLTLLLAGLPLTLLLAGLVPQVMLLARLAAHSRQAACSLVPLTCSSFSQICCGLQCIQQQGYHQQVCKVSTRFSIPQSCKEHAVCCSAYCLLCYNTVSQLRS